MIPTVGDISRVSAHLYGDKTALIIEDKQFHTNASNERSVRIPTLGVFTSRPGQPRLH